MRLTGWPYSSWFQSIPCWYANICKLQSVYTDIFVFEYYPGVNKQNIKTISLIFMIMTTLKRKDDGLKIILSLETNRVLIRGGYFCLLLSWEESCLLLCVLPAIVETRVGHTVFKRQWDFESEYQWERNTILTVFPAHQEVLTGGVVRFVPRRKFKQSKELETFSCSQVLSSGMKTGSVV